MTLVEVQTEWPAGFKSGDAVVHRGKMSHVISIAPERIPLGHVPILYDDAEKNCVLVPADDLNHRFSH